MCHLWSMATSPCISTLLVIMTKLKSLFYLGGEYMIHASQFSESPVCPSIFYHACQTQKCHFCSLMNNRYSIYIYHMIWYVQGICKEGSQSYMLLGEGKIQFANVHGLNLSWCVVVTPLRSQELK